MAALNHQAAGQPGELPSGLPAELAWLLTRRSSHQLTAPGPGDEQLAWMLRAAARVPDFHALQPYRLLLARGDGLVRLGLAMERAARRAGQPDKVIMRAPRMPQRAPLVIVVVASPKFHPLVPEFDQQLCAGGVVLTLHLAARALGYASVWRSGWPMYCVELREELGLASRERIVGFLYLGTAVEPAETPAPQTASPDPPVPCSWL